MESKRSKANSSLLELAATDRKMLYKSVQVIDESCNIVASEKEGQQLNQFKKSMIPVKNDSDGFNFDYGAPNKGTPQIDQVFQQLSLWTLIKRNVWYYYDGIAFFTFNDTKLNRIRRKPASILDKFTSVNECLYGSIMSLIVILIIVQQVRTLGSVKSQEITFTH